MQKIVSVSRALRILIIVPGGLNYFYDEIGTRLAAALRNLGCHVDVRLLKTYQAAEYDLTLYVNLYEIVFMHAADYPDALQVEHVTALGHDPSFGRWDRALRVIADIQSRTRHSGNVVLDCVKTPWFGRNYTVCQLTGIHTLYDLGLQDQANSVTDYSNVTYRFVFNGLTEQERQRVLMHQRDQRSRLIPWAFIGQSSKQRLQFAQELVQRLGPDGVFYLPIRRPIASGGPQFNAAQLQRLLENTRYYVWISHHPYFYVESERFRNAAMAGCVPVKVLSRDSLPDIRNLPFRYLMLDETDFDEQLLMLDYNQLRQRFLKDYLAAPSLEQTLAGTMLGEICSHR